MIHNNYFSGQVQSLLVDDAPGKWSVGVIMPGEFQFSTNFPEHVRILKGFVEVKLPGESWRKVGEQGTYDVPRDVTFEVRADEAAAYICYFLEH